MPAELSLTETICIKDTRKVARDNTVKYHWRVLQLLPGEERPSYADLRVDVLERADGELMVRYQGEAVEFQEGPPSSSALWGADSGCSPGLELQEATDGVVHSHLNVAQRERVSTQGTYSLFNYGDGIAGLQQIKGSNNLSIFPIYQVKDSGNSHEILTMFASGRSYTQIAEARGNSSVIVRNAVYRIQDKVGVKSKQELVIWAFQNGLLDGVEPGS